MLYDPSERFRVGVSEYRLAYSPELCALISSVTVRLQTVSATFGSRMGALVGHRVARLDAVRPAVVTGDGVRC